MRERRFSRRDVLKSSAAAVGGLFASASRAAAPEPTAITPSLVEAARKEGKLFYYTSVDLPLQSFCFSPQAQQLSIDAGGLRSLHPQTKEKPGRKPFADIKKMKDDPA